tara:strand:- start:330 stop:479 length:150 start_codon:yes stop_codon:yes gene_type:complete
MCGIFGFQSRNSYQIINYINIFLNLIQKRVSDTSGVVIKKTDYKKGLFF